MFFVQVQERTDKQEHNYLILIAIRTEAPNMCDQSLSHCYIFIFGIDARCCEQEISNYNISLLVQLINRSLSIRMFCKLNGLGCGNAG